MRTNRRDLLGLAAGGVALSTALATDAGAAAAASPAAKPPSRLPLKSRKDDPNLYDWLEPHRPGASSSNLFQSLANCPDILRAFIPMADIVREGHGIDPGLREMAIVMACQTMGTSYELGRHWNLALRAGVAKAKLEALWDFEISPLFSPVEKAVLRLSRDATHAPAQVSQAVWSDVHSRLGDQQSLSLLFSIGWYNMTGRITGALDLQDEPDFKRL